MLRTDLTTQAIDDVLAGTFPASDPPAWTPGVAVPAPRHDDRGRADVIDVSISPADRSTAPPVVSLLGAAALSLLVPLAIFAVGAPVAVGVRGALELTGWLLTMVR